VLRYYGTQYSAVVGYKYRDPYIGPATIFPRLTTEMTSSNHLDVSIGNISPLSIELMVEIVKSREL
jgi:hypothetical protein